MGWQLVTDLSAQTPRLDFRPVHVRFVVDKVARAVGLSLDYVIFLRQYHLTNVPQSFIHLSLALCNISS